MKILVRICILVLAQLASQSMAQANPKAEVYQLNTEVDHRPVVTYVQLFAESPLANPKLLEQIKHAGLDHVLFYSETDDGGTRAPNAEDSLESLRHAIESTTQVPVVEIKTKKSFFRSVRDAWHLSFNSKERIAEEADRRYGLISTVGETATFTALLVTSGDVALANGAALVAAQTLLSYVNNVHNNSISNFLNANWSNLGQDARLSTVYFRSYVYDWVTSQIFKAIQDPQTFMSASNQALVAMNSLFAGSGDILSSNAIFKAYNQDKIKLSKVNFYVNFVGTALGSFDLIQHGAMPVLMSVGAYDLTASGILLIGYYAAAVVAVKTMPERVYSLIDRFDQSVRRYRAKLFPAREKMSCNDYFLGNFGDLSSGSE